MYVRVLTRLKTRSRLTRCTCACPTSLGSRFHGSIQDEVGEEGEDHARRYQGIRKAESSADVFRWGRGVDGCGRVGERQGTYLPPARTSSRAQ